MRASRGSLEGLVVGLLVHYMFKMQHYAGTPGAGDSLDTLQLFVRGRRGVIWQALAYPLPNIFRSLNSLRRSPDTVSVQDVTVFSGPVSGS